MHKPDMLSKPKSLRKTMIRLFKDMMKFPSCIGVIFAILFALVSSALSVITPDMMADLSESVINGGYTFLYTGTFDLNPIYEAGIILIILFGVIAISVFFQSFLLSDVTQKLAYKYRNRISDKINKMPLKYFDSKPYGDTLSRITNDVDTVGSTLNQSVLNLISSVILIVGLPVMMFISDWKLTLIVFASIPLSIILLGLIMGKSQKYFRGQQKKLGTVNGYIEEMYAGQTIVKAFNACDMTKKEFKKYNDDLYKDTWKAQFISGIMHPLMGFVGNLTYVFIIVYGGLQAIKNGNPAYIGTIIAFTIYSKMFSQQITQLSQVLTQIQSTAAAAERVFEIFDEEEMENEDEKTLRITDVKGNVSFQNVKFGYLPDTTIIKDFSIDIKAGSKIAIVGPTGAGKTTIVNLLMRFYELNSGSINIDNINIHDVTRENIHDVFGMVLQDTWLFEGSVYDNLTFGSNEEVPYEKVKEAAKAAHIHHFIKSLPNGYQTVLDETANISQGQKQLFTIARAMIEDAPMLILDEATSSVDTRTEILIQEAMDNLMKGRTSFVIAHRLSTIKNADVILVMKDGNIIETGNHQELLMKKGFYAELYNAQFDVA